MQTIKNTSMLSTELTNDKGDFTIIPNRVLADKALQFKKPSQDIISLEELKNRFVTQLPSNCGPASAQIVLSIFNIKCDQEDLSKVAKTVQRKSESQVAGTHPKKLINAIEKFTKKKVIGTWVGFDKIYDLKRELQVWLKEGALIIIDYKKRYLFPSADRAHYSVAIGLRGDELLVVDPSGKGGGVYYVDYRDVEIGMDTYSELIQGKRGYIVLAPRKTIAHQRIKDGLIYYHKSKYHKISKSLERKLNKLTSGPAMVDLLPSFVRKYLKSFEKVQISRVWKP